MPEDWGHEDCDICEAARSRPDPDELKAFAAENGIPALLDHLGLDGLGVEVNVLLARIIELEKELDNAVPFYGQVRGERDDLRVKLAEAERVEQSLKAMLASAANDRDRYLREAELRRKDYHAQVTRATKAENGLRGIRMSTSLKEAQAIARATLRPEQKR
jgi:hypothetical protein